MNIGKTVIAIIGAAFVTSACAGSGDGHSHQHGKKAVGTSMEKKAATMAPASENKTMKMAKGPSEMTSGQVKRIKKGSKKVTIKHEEIKSLEMPPMTMVFKVEDEAMLDAIKKGDNVMFNVIDKDGEMIITEIKPVK